MSSPLQQGRIVWVTTRDPNGVNEKKRPAVILTPTGEIQTDRTVLLAAISSANVASEEAIVRLTWNREGTTSTCLRRACHVVCSWLVYAPVAAVESTSGVVNPRELVAILAKVYALSPPSDAPRDQTSR
ncbi:type II toxin-antitoxin system PemK/MazF family toxin [Limnoglobus roseus]|uniref:Type II toxin-antitoxin system PemK/MazF family toxin n=1 Tax=Limnoglobus roseus TaxID=2598579 RepID=A0A5C1A5J2_9BACT|nr:hypothetical protein PX52LOC_00810 [Limnoglobus roseus]